MTKKKSYSWRLRKAISASSAGGCMSDGVVAEREFDALFDDALARAWSEEVDQFSSTSIVEIRALTDYGILNLVSWFWKGTLTRMASAPSCICIK